MKHTTFSILAVAPYILLKLCLSLIFILYEVNNRAGAPLFGFGRPV